MGCAASDPRGRGPAPSRCSRHSLHQRLKSASMFVPRVTSVLEDLLLRPLRVAHELDERLPLVLFDARRRRSCRRRSRAMNQGPSKALAAGECLAPGVGPVHEVHLEHGRDASCSRHLDRLSLAGLSLGTGGRPSSSGSRGAHAWHLVLGAERLERRQLGMRRRAGAQERPAGGVRGGQLVARCRPRVDRGRRRGRSPSRPESDGRE